MQSLQMVVFIAAFLILVSTWRKHPTLGIVSLPGFAAVAFAFATSIWGELMIEAAAVGPAMRVWTVENISIGVEVFSWSGLALMAGPWAQASSNPQLSLSARPLSQVVVLENVVRNSWASTASLIITSAYVVIYGAQNLWERNVYIPYYAFERFSSFAAPLLPAGFALAALGYFSVAKSSRIIGVLAVLASVVVAFGTASRILAVFPILWLAVMYVTGQRIRVHSLVVSLVIIAFASSLALSMRNSVHHGVLPYTLVLLEAPPPLSLDGVVDSLLNILFAVPLAGAVVANSSFGIPELITSVNPSLAGDAGWTELAPRLRVHQYIPFNGIGELATASYPLAITTCFLVSWFAAGLVRRAVLARQSTLVVVSMSLYFLVFILLLQYNLRSSMRVVYLMGALLIVGNVVMKRVRKSAPTYRSLDM